MASKEIYASASGARLFGGLDWRVLDAARSVDSALRITGGERAATHAVTVKSSATETIQVGKKAKKVKEVQRTSGGFLATADGEGPGKQAHSLAAAFAAWSHEHEAAVLYVQVRGGQYAVVVVLNGLPVLDKVVESADLAYPLAASYLRDHPNISVFADDSTRFPATLLENGLLESIAAACSKATLIKPLPVDALKLAVIGLVALGVLGGYWGYSKHKAEKARQEALARARAEDPVPKYLDALNAQRHNVGIERKSLLAAFESAKKIPAAAGGWKLKQVSCVKDAGCAAEFDRVTGTFASLRTAVPFLELDQSASLNLNQARMTWKQELAPQGIDPGVPALALGEFVRGASGSEMQNWLVAGLALQAQPPMLWPQAPGVPANFKHPRAIAMGKYEIGSVALPFVEEVLTKAPANVLWMGWSLELGDEKQPALARAKARVVGTYYVQN